MLFIIFVSVRFKTQKIGAAPNSSETCEIVPRHLSPFAFNPRDELSNSNSSSNVNFTTYVSSMLKFTSLMLARHTCPPRGNISFRSTDSTLSIRPTGLELAPSVNAFAGRLTGTGCMNEKWILQIGRKFGIFCPQINFCQNCNHAPKAGRVYDRYRKFNVWKSTGCCQMCCEIDNFLAGWRWRSALHNLNFVKNFWMSGNIKVGVLSVSDKVTMQCNNSSILSTVANVKRLLLAFVDSTQKSSGAT